MNIFFLIFIASLLQAIVSFSGAALAIFREDRVKRFAHYVVSFAVGALLGVALLDLIPEALWLGTYDFAALAPFVFGGILLFFVLEKFFLWRHHHDDIVLEEHYTKLILWGDFLHNLIDGIILALAFLADVRLGVITTIAVIFHEIPQEISDFGLLIHGGMSRKKALLYNFLVSLSTVGGALATVAFGNITEPYLPYALALTAGNFIYIAVADLIPELHEKATIRHTIFQVVFIFAGTFFVLLPEYLILS